MQPDLFCVFQHILLIHISSMAICDKPEPQFIVIDNVVCILLTQQNLSTEFWCAPQFAATFMCPQLHSPMIYTNFLTCFALHPATLVLIYQLSISFGQNQTKCSLALYLLHMLKPCILFDIPYNIKYIQVPVNVYYKNILESQAYIHFLLRHCSYLSFSTICQDKAIHMFGFFQVFPVCCYCSVGP